MAIIVQMTNAHKRKAHNQPHQPHQTNSVNGHAHPKPAAQIEHTSFPTFDPTTWGIKENAFQVQRNETGDYVFHFAFPDLSQIRDAPALNRDQILCGVPRRRDEYHLEYHRSKSLSFETDRSVPALLMEAVFDRGTGLCSSRSIKPTLFRNSKALAFHEAEPVFDDHQHELHGGIRAAYDFYHFIGRHYSEMQKICRDQTVGEPEGTRRMARITAMVSLVANWQAAELLNSHNFPAVYSVARNSQMEGHIISSRGGFYDSQPMRHEELRIPVYCVVSRPLRDALATANALQIGAIAHARPGAKLKPHFNFGICTDFAYYGNLVRGKRVIFDDNYELYGSHNPQTFQFLPANQLCVLFDMLCYEPLNNRVLATAIQQRLSAYAKNHMQEHEYASAAQLLVHIMLGKYSESTKTRIGDILKAGNQALTQNPSLAPYCLEHAHEYGTSWQFAGWEWQTEGHKKKVIPKFRIRDRRWRTVEGDTNQYDQKNKQSNLESVVARKIFQEPDLHFVRLEHPAAGYTFMPDPKQVLDDSLAIQILDAIPDELSGWSVEISEHVYFQTHNGGRVLSLADRNKGRKISYGISCYEYTKEGGHNRMYNLETRALRTTSEAQQILIEFLRSGEFSEILLNNAAPEFTEICPANIKIGRAHDTLMAHGLCRTKSIYFIERNQHAPDVTPTVLSNHRVAALFRFHFKDGGVLHQRTSAPHSNNVCDRLRITIAEQVIGHFSVNGTNLEHNANDSLIP